MTRSVRTLAALAAAALVAGCHSKEEGCPAGQERCNGVCVDPASYAGDPASCGSCGNACPNGASCVSGVCECPAGRIACDGACVDPLTSGAHCGGCGISCGVGTCAAGACACGAFATCASPLPRCADTQNDPRNCGSCGYVCPLTNATCNSGGCGCSTTDTPCPQPNPTACVNLQTDEANCGSCGNACPTGASCNSGTYNCLTAGESVCGGACVDTRTDESNCGSCGRVCPAGATCAGSACGCPDGETTVCGVDGGSAGTCCAGTTCCGAQCATQHSNGVGQSFEDCRPLGTYDLTQAEEAAQAWNPAGAPPTFTLMCASCFAWQTSSACGTWCYGPAGDPLRGRAVVIQSLVCQCPSSGTPNWN